MNQGVLKLRGESSNSPRKIALSIVLPPISTEGLTTDDVTSLTESTRETMLATLREISEPGPASITEVKEEPSNADTSVVPVRVVETVLSTLVEPVEILEQKEEFDLEKSKSSEEDSESLEDEMDEDAVLLKRPRDIEMA
jgi:lysophosphatidate acyltransferase